MTTSFVPNGCLLPVKDEATESMLQRTCGARSAEPLWLPEKRDVPKRLGPLWPPTKQGWAYHIPNKNGKRSGHGSKANTPSERDPIQPLK